MYNKQEGMRWYEGISGIKYSSEQAKMVWYLSLYNLIWKTIDIFSSILEPSDLCRGHLTTVICTLWLANWSCTNVGGDNKLAKGRKIKQKVWNMIKLWDFWKLLGDTQSLWKQGYITEHWLSALGEGGSHLKALTCWQDFAIHAEGIVNHTHSKAHLWGAPFYVPWHRKSVWRI